MITVNIRFYDKKTEVIVDTVKLHLPEYIIFASSGSTEISYINAVPFNASDEMRHYVTENYPELKVKFDLYLHSVIGRHGLGPKYG